MRKSIYTGTKEKVAAQLMNPRPEARDKTRWWWYGCAVETEEIDRELDYMAEAGIGGIELQILYPVRANSKELGIQNQFYFSPGFFEAIKYAQEGALKRGMQFDFTLGSSWPYGGPFVPEEYSAQNVIPYSIDVKGPCTFSYDFTTRIYGECAGCIMGKMEDCRMLPETIVDLTERITDKYLFRWEWGKELKALEIPEGNYKIVLFMVNDKKQMVLKPIPGGEGLIVDHSRKDAVRDFLENAGSPIAEYLGEGSVCSYFCDSIEVFGQNWTGIIYDEFRKRRGYELRPYIYALWGEVKGMTEYIRYDFQKTLAELTVENFFEELTKWCHEKGALSRIQAHGTWGDILKAYGAADIPEGETFSEFDKYEVNTIHRKLASSAGHIYRKPVISNESFTWLRFPRFIVTLEQIKAAADAIFLDGMNQIVNHGYAYSPEGAGKLGWAFYASSQINHTNTWWSHFKHISLYINRVCDFLQRGRTKVKLAVYLPQHDIWAENPLSDIHMCMKLEERMATETVDAIHKAGYWFDYVNDDVLECWDEYEYEALLFLSCVRIPVQTARNIKRCSQRGTKIISMGEAPHKSCGLIDYEKQTEEVRGIFKELIGEKRCVVTEGSTANLLRHLQSSFVPDVRIVNHPEHIGYIHQVNDEEDIYFISNISNTCRRERIIFSGQMKECSVFDPMTALEKRIISINHTEDETEAELILEPYQSVIFVFAPTMKAEYALQNQDANAGTLLDISKGWEFYTVETGYQKTYDTLSSWEKEEALRYYSGEGIYIKYFVIGEEVWKQAEQSEHVYLKLAHIGETADIYVNGKPAGVLFMHPYSLDIRKFLRSGGNVLEVRVRNLLINCAINPEYPEPVCEDQIIDEWPYHTAKLNREIRERVYNWRERKMIAAPLHSGLWGEILLEYEVQNNL